MYRVRSDCIHCRFRRCLPRAGRPLKLTAITIPGKASLRLRCRATDAIWHTGYSPAAGRRRSGDTRSQSRARTSASARRGSSRSPPAPGSGIGSARRALRRGHHQVFARLPEATVVFTTFARQSRKPTPAEKPKKKAEGDAERRRGDAAALNGGGAIRVPHAKDNFELNCRTRATDGLAFRLCRKPNTPAPAKRWPDSRFEERGARTTGAA